MTEIKICGITRIDDALCAAACGADAVGFIFHEASPRYIAPERAKEIIAALPRGITTVGVFVNREAEEVAQTVANCGLDLIQLHGNESPEYCRRFPPERIIKAVFPRTPKELRALAAYDVRAFLVDFREAGRYGGTGKRADWGLAARLAKERPLILAGGLSIENIGEALAAVAPHAVDINSGCERAPGIKDHDRIRRIIALIRREGSCGPRTIFAGETNLTRTKDCPLEPDGGHPGSPGSPGHFFPPLGGADVLKGNQET
jgi:phosphoribosylanthranilate isomerase